MLGHSPLAGASLASNVITYITVSAIGSSSGAATVAGAGKSLAAAAGSSAGSASVSGALRATAGVSGASSGSASASSSGVTAIRAAGSSEGTSEASGTLFCFTAYVAVLGSATVTGVSSRLVTSAVSGTASGAGSARGYSLQGGVGTQPIWRFGGPISAQPFSFRAISSASYSGNNEAALEATEEQDVVSFRVFNEAWYEQAGPGGAWTEVAPAEPDWTAADGELVDIWENRD